MSRKLTRDVFFEVYHEHTDSWVETKFMAKCAQQDGRVYRLFRSGVLAKVIFRTTRTIRQWESEGRIPSPRFAFEGNRTYAIGGGEERWYSEEQIRMVSCHQRGIFGDNPKTSKGPHINLEAFFKAICEDWNLESFNSDNYEYNFETVIKGRKNVHV